MKKALKWLDVNFEPMMIMIIFISMFTLITLQVILRFIFDTGFAWGEEVATFAFVWLCFLGIPYSLRNNRQIGVDFIRGRLPEKIRKYLVLVVDASMLVLMAIFFYGSVITVSQAARYNDLAQSIPVTMNVVHVAASVGYCLSMLRIIQTVVWRLRRFNASFDLFYNYCGAYYNEKIFFMPKIDKERSDEHIDTVVCDEATYYIGKTKGDK